MDCRYATNIINAIAASSFCIYISHGALRAAARGNAAAAQRPTLQLLVLQLLVLQLQQLLLLLYMNGCCCCESSSRGTVVFLVTWGIL